MPRSLQTPPRRRLRKQASQRWISRRNIPEQTCTACISRPLPDDLHFVQGDIRGLINAQKAPFSPGNFHYVFSRLMILGVADWPAHIAVLASLLARNGYIELEEAGLLSIITRTASPRRSCKALKQDCAALGLDHNAGPHLSARMKATPGSVDVQAQRYRLMCTTQGVTQAKQRLAENSTATLVPLLGTMIDSLSAKAGRGENERRRLKGDVALGKGSFEAGTHMDFRATWARKA
ncbi:hypothetical protein EJ03DRAFT_92533 [Teratosphaeria nubilosa]|uniref:Methyltransferase type 11 domain-containing protein n=1 Tax=Teratosphaeria nubilosa TaxID=161662 RepID=A0A6G1L970_9PEZI|nr:hypothetical protein EJ03DRAFT_92533 [Teratosphaeria nubilosa]